MKMAAYQFNQFFIAHWIGGALGNGRLFELGGFAKVAHELLLDRAGAGNVNCIRILQMVCDFFEKLPNQGFFEVVRGVLVGIRSGTRILGMAKDGEFGAAGVVPYDGCVVSIHPNPELLFDFF